MPALFAGRPRHGPTTWSGHTAAAGPRLIRTCRGLATCRVGCWKDRRGFSRVYSIGGEFRSARVRGVDLVVLVALAVHQVLQARPDLLAQAELQDLVVLVVLVVHQDLRALAVPREQVDRVDL